MPRSNILLILDGWGYNPDSKHNAIAQATTPNYDNLLRQRPFAYLEASGAAVGLPDGQIGNSEVGHMTIGSGRVILQDLPRINQAIENGELESNKILKKLISGLKGTGGTCHLLGLISDGGVHSHIEHVIAIGLILTKHNIPVCLHAITDGRDVAPQSAARYLSILKEHGFQVATICGRFYAMDRDARWDRTETAYNAIVLANGPKFDEPMDALQDSYVANIMDEFVIPSVANGYQGFQDGDALLMANFRADRVRQILNAIVLNDFHHFSRGHTPPSIAVGLTEYSEQLRHLVLPMFEDEEVRCSIGEVVARAHMRQLRIAETEKYAHVTFFLNGGREEVFEGEERILIPSPKVKTYDTEPQMSVFTITEQLLKSIRSNTYDFICVNFANADMVGHTGNFNATVKAIEAVDICLGRILKAIAQTNAELLITADHGNAELMYNNETLEAVTAHTLFKVPVIYIGHKQCTLRSGSLADIAPTMLDIMGLKKPVEIEGASLIQEAHA